jgi:hypothetical protein
MSGKDGGSVIGDSSGVLNTPNAGPTIGTSAVEGGAVTLFFLAGSGRTSAAECVGCDSQTNVITGQTVINSSADSVMLYRAAEVLAARITNISRTAIMVLCHRKCPKASMNVEHQSFEIQSNILRLPKDPISILNSPLGDFCPEKAEPQKAKEGEKAGMSTHFLLTSFVLFGYPSNRHIALRSFPRLTINQQSNLF